MKRENAKKEENIFINLEETVKYLEECRNRGKNIYVEFNSCGKIYKLYSCDTTIITAYLEVVGMLKEEREKYLSKVISAKTNEESDRIASEAIYHQNQNKKIPFNELYQMYINSLKKEATEVKESHFYTIKEAVGYLEECRNNGLNVYLDFNSVNGIKRFYSCDITIELAYKQIFNISKEDVEILRNKMIEANTEEDTQLIIEEYKKLIK